MQNTKKERNLVSMKDLVDDLGLSASTIRRLIHKGEFPQPIKITQSRVVFIGSEIEQWITEAIQRGKAANDNE